MEEYAGYRVQIDGEIFPDRYIARGSYKMSPCIKRKVSEFNDANGKRHILYYPRTGVEITFKIRKRNEKDQAEVVKFFSEKDIYDLVYWDDREMKYKTGDFRLSSNLIYVHERIGKNTIRYGETEIKFERV